MEMLRRYWFLIVVLVVINFLLLFEKQTIRTKTTPKVNVSNTSSQTPQEVLEIKATKDIDKQVALYKKLIERVGPELAQEELKRSGLPFDGQTHLLNHVVGDLLYEKYGAEGLVYCKDYFLSSCYHGFVIHAVGRQGFEVLPDVMGKCWESGETVAVQCAHAIGHGFLAYVGYAHLTGALAQCDKLAGVSQRFPLYNCHDGVFMENVWAVHESGKPSPDRWVRDSDPIYPCNEPRIPDFYIQACWSNQPMRMYQMFGGDLGRVGKICLGVGNQKYRGTCFDGLARQIHPLTNGSADETFRLCSLMSGDWIDPCIISIAKSEFGVGGRTIPFTLCSRIRDESKSSCYNGLSDVIRAYYPKLNEKTPLCSQIPDSSARANCLK